MVFQVLLLTCMVAGVRSWGYRLGWVGVIVAVIAAAGPAYGSSLPQETGAAVNPAPQFGSILVIGDSMAGQLAAGLDWHRSKPGVDFVLSVGARYQSTESLATLKGYVESRSVDALVVLFGTWDVGSFEPGELRQHLLSGEYRLRLMNWRTAMATTGTPLVWVTMPSAEDNELSGHLARVNRVIRSVAREFGDEVVESGRVLDGPKRTFRTEVLAGRQRVKVRSSDGLHLCAAGTILLADRVLGSLGQRSRIWPRHLQRAARQNFLEGSDFDSQGCEAVR